MKKAILILTLSGMMISWACTSNRSPEAEKTPLISEETSAQVDTTLPPPPPPVNPNKTDVPPPPPEKPKK